MDPESGAGLLHRLTAYSPARDWDVPAEDPRVRHDLVANDPETLPPPVKSYPDGLPVLSLARDLPPSPPAGQVLSGTAAPARSLAAAELGRVLFLGAGVVRTSVHRLGPMLFRAAGSAGGRFPLEVYASTRDVDGVPDGVHWYDPVDHALVQVGPPAGGDATTLVVTGIPWRTGWRYAERGWRHQYWDGGTLLAQLLAASAGLDPLLRSDFPDAQVRQLVGADGVHEQPLALLTLGSGAPAIKPGGRAEPGYLPQVELPLCTTAQQAGERLALGEPWSAGAVVGGAPETAPLDRVVLARGSQRRMDATAALPREQLTWAMSVAMRGIDVPHWVVVHAVDGMEPGVYRWPELDRPVRTASLREELMRLALGQGLAADAAYVVIGAVSGDLLDDRSYRTAQLAAGVVEGRLHLAAYATGATATGMTFLDSEVPALLGEGPDLVTLLWTCVGVGEYRSTPGGGPGAPVAVRPVASRLAED